MQKSRLKETTKARTKKSILLTILGIVALLAVIAAFGIQFLINFSVQLGKISGSPDSTANTEEEGYIPPPILDIPPSATNSAAIKITGYTTSKDYTVKLYVNGSYFDKKSVKDDKSFSFTNVTLESGENDIKAKAVTEEDQESEYSTSIRVNYIDKMPEITIDHPYDGQTVSQDRLSVRGITDPNNIVTINDSRAILDGEGKFDYTMKLQNGDNKIKVVATDYAGNQTTKELKVTFSP